MHIFIHYFVKVKFKNLASWKSYIAISFLTKGLEHTQHHNYDLQPNSYIKKLPEGLEHTKSPVLQILTCMLIKIIIIIWLIIIYLWEFQKETHNYMDSVLFI